MEKLLQMNKLAKCLTIFLNLTKIKIKSKPETDIFSMNEKSSLHHPQSVFIFCLFRTMEFNYDVTYRKL